MADDARARITSRLNAGALRTSHVLQKSDGSVSVALNGLHPVLVFRTLDMNDVHDVQYDRASGTLTIIPADATRPAVTARRKDDGSP